MFDVSMSSHMVRFSAIKKLPEIENLFHECELNDMIRSHPTNKKYDIQIASS